MSLYHAQVRIHASRWAPYFSRELTAEALGTAITNVLVRRLTALADQGYEAELLLQRPTHEDALLEISAAIERLGYAVGEAFIVEYASAVAESAVSGFFGAGALGATSRNPVIALVAAGAGAAVGAAVGRFIQIEKARYEGVWNPYTNSWQLTQVAAPSGPQIRFGYA
jgi:hypothetical protein